MSDVDKRLVAAVRKLEELDVRRAITDAIGAYERDAGPRAKCREGKGRFGLFRGEHTTSCGPVRR